MSVVEAPHPSARGFQNFFKLVQAFRIAYGMAYNTSPLALPKGWKQASRYLTIIEDVRKVEEKGARYVQLSVATEGVQETALNDGSDRRYVLTNGIVTHNWSNTTHTTHACARRPATAC